MKNKLMEIPSDILSSSKNYFDYSTILEAQKLFRLGRFTISFQKGSPEQYYIISGIVKASQSYQCKLVYKKRFENTPQGPITSNCTCKQWTATGHCPHVICLFFSYNIQRQYKDYLQHTDSTPLPSIGTMGVEPLEYGTIIAGPQALIGAPPSCSYSSLQYILTSKKIVHFPIPEELNCKLLVEFDEELHILKFKLKYPDATLVNEISIFENLYIFDWKQGRAFHLPRPVKEFIQTLRLHYHLLDTSELIQNFYFHQVESDCDLILKDALLSQFEKKELNARIAISSGAKKNLINLALNFYDNDNHIITPPTFLTAFAFQGGMLGSFRRKIDSYQFISTVVSHLENPAINYKKDLTSNPKKDRWIKIISFVTENQYSYSYDPQQKALYRQENKFLITLLVALNKYFGDMCFRFSQYQDDTKAINYQLSPANLFQGLTPFQSDLNKYHVNLYYDRNEISVWSSQIRFERRMSTSNWFQLEFEISDQDLQVIENADLDNGLVLTDKGLILLRPDQKELIRFMKKYTAYESEHKIKENKSNRFVLPFNRTRIFELFELKKLGLEGVITEEEKQLCQRLATLEEIPQYNLPQLLENIARPYQVTGFNWLRFLYENKLGACLADDMGLGKTLQALAFIQSIADNIGQVLVICPVTIILNWEKEIEKFSTLKSHIYHGGSRQLPADAKIILTSYGVMKKEADTVFAQKEFDILVLDEVQHLKNLRSLGAFAARKLKARFRICLTGTPVENDLAEFYNIIDLCVPGIWGDLQFIRAESNKKNRFLARKMARPFILRRTKAQVLTDLPPKIENNVYLTMTEYEQEEYKKSLLQIRSRIKNSASKHKYGEILKGLLELRQKCLWQKGTNIRSSKVEFLLENLEQIIEEGHQAIVFSQFTSYLDIIQQELQARHWPIARIDGSQSIKTRQKQIDLFQKGDTPIFLISLKAGGVGLNLTAASYVFVMDPWWNPAVEAQAIDRAHRIGQTNTLTVYRPIIKSSVEEKVLELQKAKKELFYDLLPENDENYFTGKLTMRDFEHLLEVQ